MLLARITTVATDAICQRHERTWPPGSYRLLRASFDTQVRQGAYWDIDGFFNVSVKQGAPQPISEYGYSRGFAREIAKIRTDLDAFSASEQKILENHGYMTAAMAIAELGDELARATTAAEMAAS